MTTGLSRWKGGKLAAFHESDHSEAEFSHSICPDCMNRLYPGYAKAVADKSKKDSGTGE